MEREGMDIALSTSWCAGDPARLRGVLPHVDSLEAGSRGGGSFQVSVSEIAREAGVPVTSVHAVAHPEKDVNEADYASPCASLEEKPRRQAVDAVTRSAEWADRLGAGFLVLHTGRVEDEGLRELCRAYRESVRTGRPADGLKSRILRRRAGRAHAHLDRVIEGLDGLCSLFPDLTFCIETRVHYDEIPLPHEMARIFLSLPGRKLGYWHDIGHTYTLDVLGYASMGSWQRMFPRRCGGLHIHDVGGGLRDHYPPGSGILDLRSILENFDGRESVFTVEVNARHTLPEVIGGIEHLRDIVGAKTGGSRDQSG
jgi:sugar phosphate isomerase/epimerase